MNDKNIENPNNFVEQPNTIDNNTLERYQNMMNNIKSGEKELTANDIRYKNLKLQNNRRKEKNRKKHNLRLRRRSK